MTRSLEEPSEEGGFESWAELREEVDDKDGVLQVQMWELRELIGRGRLGVHVRASITRELAGMGIAHLPPELPGNQYDSVVLYRLGTAAAAVIGAVNGNDVSSAETVLRQLNVAGETERLQTIAEKVDELREKFDELDEMIK